MAVNIQALGSLSNVLLQKGLHRGINQAFYESHFVLELFRKTSEHLVGGEFILPIEAIPNTNSGPRRRDAGIADSNGRTVWMPPTGAIGHRQAKVQPANYWGGISTTVSALQQKEGKKEVLVPWLKRLLLSGTGSVRRDLCMDAYGDGTGTLAKVKTSSGGNSTVVKVDDVRLLHIGQRLEKTAADGTSPVAVVISNIRKFDPTTGDLINEIDIDVSITTTAGERLLRVGQNDNASAAASYNAAIVGFAAAIGTVGNQYLGLDRATNPWWNPNVYDNKGAQWDSNIAHQFMLEIEGRSTDGKITHLLSNYGPWSQYGALFYGEREWQGQVKTLDHGWKYLEFFGVKWVLDRYCPPDRVHFIDKETWYWGPLQDIGYIKPDGNMWRMPRSDSEEIEARALWSGAFYTNAPWRNGTITGIAA